MVFLGKAAKYHIDFGHVIGAEMRRVAANL